ncbi:hypothetical protein SLEP1_g15057 [Rubroshorea leprosula]|uniref:Uncharacterized protein n=1 Tax=Rubroshorea leprosula TaxID=152421 RepID=A0AAV5IVL1_9ROSI|nr:hypothetical protein SLEP1_g15057 [Rubroshorea leprosula]
MSKRKGENPVNWPFSVKVGSPKFLSISLRNCISVIV